MLFCDPPHWVSSCGLLIVTNNFPHRILLMCAGCLCHIRATNSNPFCYKYSPLDLLITAFFFFSFVCGCLVLLVFTSTVRVSDANFRLHNSAYKDRIESSCCLNCVDRLPFVVVILLKTVYLAAVADTKFVKESSTFPCLKLLALP